MWKLAFIYTAIPAFAAISSQLENIKAKRPLWFIAADFASDAIALLLFLGYWWRGMLHGIGGLAPFLFLFSIF